MSDEFKDFEETPTPVLTFGEPVLQTQDLPAEQKAEPQLTEAILTDEEKKMVDDFSRQINLHDSNGILQYGVGTQKKMADFSENALKNVKTKDLGEVGDMISSLVTELKSFDVDEEDKGFLGLFKKSGNKLTAMKAKYEKAEVNVEKICEVLEDHQVQLMKDVAMLDKMYDLNLSYFKELSMYILAGKKRLEEVRATELTELTEKANRSGLPEDAQAAKDLESLCERFEKKLHDLELTRMIAIQTAPQIRLVQSSDSLMIEKIQSTVVNTIPLWKSQMVIALGVEHANQAAKAQQEVTDMTNELLRKNAESLKVATVESAKASERGIVDLETLKTTNAALISTFDEVMRIQEDGRKKRREAEAELNRMETELKNKLLEIHK
jgi:uncharacterized protein YaaN involved in tellurite resistance